MCSTAALIEKLHISLTGRAFLSRTFAVTLRRTCLEMQSRRRGATGALEASMKSKKKLWLLIAGVILCVGSALGWSHFRNQGGALYQTAPVTRGRIDSTVAATGTLNAVVTVQVGSQVSGNIKALYADFNTK